MIKTDLNVIADEVNQASLTDTTLFCFNGDGSE